MHGALRANLVLVEQQLRQPAGGDPDDPYAEYRRRRSGRYHSIMASKSTNPNRPPMGH